MAKGVISGATGGIAFIFLMFGIEMSTPLAIVSSVAVFIATQLLLSSPSKEVTIEHLEHDFYQKTIDQAREKIEEIERARNQILNMAIQGKIDVICHLSRKIIEMIEKNPQEIQVIRNFFTYYLDAIVNIIRKYVEIVNQQSKDTEIQKILTKTENLLDLIISLFESKVMKLMADDVLELDTEIETMKKIIEAEGDLK